MNYPLKILLVIFVSIAVFFYAGISKCEEESREMHNFRGQVTNIDWVGSFITVDGGDDMTFYVPDGATIIKLSEKVTLSDINLNDYVYVKYYNDSSGEPRALNITLEGSYPSY